MNDLNEIVQHIPTFVETREPPPRHCFRTLEELLAVPFVQQWATDPDFFRFSMSDGYLMAEQRGGRHWWAVGWCRFPVEGLPEWDGGIAEAKDAHGKPLDIPGREVFSYYGDVITLHDGRRFYRLDSPRHGIPSKDDDQAVYWDAT